MRRGQLTLDDPRRSLKKTIEQLTHRKRTWEVWSDFCELSAITIANAVDLSSAREKREARYHQIREQYKADEFARFPFALACVVECLEAGLDDVLGAMFMELDLASHWHGQFFTPYHLASMMARMTFDPQLAKDREFIRVQEPACGAGGMLIALVDSMRDAQFNPQQCMHATAIDIDPLCVHMCFVQLSLLHIPAIVIHGNTLSLEEWSHWYTPAHILNLWNVKLRRAERAPAAEPIPAVEITREIPRSNDVEQLALF